MHGIPSEVLGETAATLASYRELAEKAIAELSDEQLVATLDEESNSIAVIMMHVGGNMRSRWRDFLTSDGEKADRDRDAEFDPPAAVTREQVMASWDAGWREAFSSLDRLRPTDLDATITIRGEPHSVVQALFRQLSHTAYHVGQIVLLAKHYRGAEWRSLSMPRNRR